MRGIQNGIIPYSNSNTQSQTLILHQFFGKKKLKNLDNNQEARANERFSQGRELK